MIIILNKQMNTVKNTKQHICGCVKDHLIFIYNEISLTSLVYKRGKIIGRALLSNRIYSLLEFFRNIFFLWTIDLSRIN